MHDVDKFLSDVEAVSVMEKMSFVDVVMMMLEDNDAGMITKDCMKKGFIKMAEMNC